MVIEVQLYSAIKSYNSSIHKKLKSCLSVTSGMRSDKRKWFILVPQSIQYFGNQFHHESQRFHHNLLNAGLTHNHEFVLSYVTHVLDMPDEVASHPLRSACVSTASLSVVHDRNVLKL